jgi:hypothetical protein
MSIFFLVMHECFVVFDFELQEYLTKEKNDKNFKTSFVISFFFGFSWFITKLMSKL